MVVTYQTSDSFKAATPYHRLQSQTKLKNARTLVKKDRSIFTFFSDWTKTALYCVYILFVLIKHLWCSGSMDCIQKHIKCLFKMVFQKPGHSSIYWNDSFVLNVFQWFQWIDWMLKMARFQFYEKSVISRRLEYPKNWNQDRRINLYRQIIENPTLWPSRKIVDNGSTRNLKFGLVTRRKPR